ncbi:hypothetical protein F4604DRAFT_1904058 [Suillus subluteus]|nr:hypothetical protein F4604DRAFT_1904058 [Suillus subluteus]
MSVTGNTCAKDGQTCNGDIFCCNRFAFCATNAGGGAPVCEVPDEFVRSNTVRQYCDCARSWSVLYDRIRSRRLQDETSVGWPARHDLGAKIKNQLRSVSLIVDDLASDCPVPVKDGTEYVKEAGVDLTEVEVFGACHGRCAAISASGSKLTGSFNSRDGSDDEEESGVVFAHGGRKDKPDCKDDEDEHLKDEFIAHFNQFSAQRCVSFRSFQHFYRSQKCKCQKPKVPTGPLVIPSKPDPDSGFGLEGMTREAARKRRAGAAQFILDCAKASTGASRRVGGLGSCEIWGSEGYTVTGGTFDGHGCFSVFSEDD